MRTTTPCILLIEDNKDFREAVRNYLYLHHIHAHIIEAGSGEEAIILAKRKKPEIAVTDFALGGINGLETAKEIKKNFPGCNIIMLSLYDPGEIFRKDGKKLVKFFISKCDLYDDLIPAINRILRGSHTTKTELTGNLKGR